MEDHQLKKIRFFRCLPGKIFDGLFHRCDRSLLARPWLARIETSGDWEGEKREGLSFTPSGNERRVPFFDRSLWGDERVSARSFCTPPKLHSRCRKELRYTTCKCILNVTVKCPYSKTPPTHAICREKKNCECGERERERKMCVRRSDWLCELINYMVVRAFVWKCEDTFVRLSYFFPGCKMGKMEIRMICTPIIVMWIVYL